MVEKAELQDFVGNQVVEQREHQIVDLMTDNLKGETEHLFNLMSALPAARRMSVMPGVKYEDPPGKRVRFHMFLFPIWTSKSVSSGFFQ